MEPLLSVRLSTVKLLVLTSLERLLSIMQTFFTFLTKPATLKWRSSVLSFPLHLVLLGMTNEDITVIYFLLDELVSR
jgi:hypothetical protein